LQAAAAAVAQVQVEVQQAAVAVAKEFIQTTDLVHKMEQAQAAVADTLNLLQDQVQTA
jgi:hypothetical protein